MASKLELTLSQDNVTNTISKYTQTSLSSALTNAGVSESTAKTVDNIVNYDGYVQGYAALAGAANSAISSDANDYIDKMQAKAEAKVNEAEKYVNEQIQQFMSNSASTIMNALGINAAATSLAKTISKARAGMSAIKIPSILNYLPADQTTIVDLSAISTLNASFKSLVMEEISELKYSASVLLEGTNANFASPLALAQQAVNTVLAEITDNVDKYCYQYLGMSIEEVAYKAEKGIEKIKAYKAAALQKKQQTEKYKEEVEKNQQKIDDAKEEAENIKNDAEAKAANLTAQSSQKVEEAKQANAALQAVKEQIKNTESEIENCNNTINNQNSTAEEKKNAEEKKKSLQNKLKELTNQLKNKEQEIEKEVNAKIKEEINKIKKEAEEKAKQKIESITNKVQSDAKEKASKVSIANSNVANTVKSAIKSVDPDQMKEELMSWLKKQSDTLYNAFMFIEFKQAAEPIQTFLMQSHDLNLDTIDKVYTVYSETMEIIDGFGIEEATAITLEEAISLGMNAEKLVENTLNNAIENAKNTASKISSASTKFVNQQKSKYEQIAQVASDTADVASEYLAKIKSTGSTEDEDDSDTQDACEISADGTNITITLNAEPDSDGRNKVREVFKAMVNNSSERMITDAQIKQITDLMSTVWTSWPTSSNTTQISAISDTKTMLSITINCNKSTTNDSSTANKKTASELISDYNALYSENADLLETALSTGLSVNTLNNITSYSGIDTVINDVISSLQGAATANVYDQTAITDKRYVLQPVKTLYKLLKKIQQLLQPIITLIMNYRTNKQLEHDGACANLSAMLDKLMKDEGKDGEVDLSKKNFYTIRTKKLYNYCIQEFKVTSDNSGMVNNPSVTISATYTNQLITYLTEQGKPHSELTSDWETVLYIDKTSINGTDEDEKEDGTNSYLPNITIDNNANKVFYITSGLNNQSSQILMAIASGKQ